MTENSVQAQEVQKWETENSAKELALSKDPTLDSIANTNSSSLKKYKNFFVGDDSFSALLKYELLTVCLGPLPGALGLFLRKMFYPKLFKKVGPGLVIGRNITFRHSNMIELGERVAIDDDCLIDAKGSGSEGIKIGNDVLIARGSIIQTKTGPISIGNRCSIGSQCQLSSGGGISIGESVMISGQCYIGGGRYFTNNREIPMMDQGTYTNGPVVIGDDVWLGAGVVVQDGVRIGKGCVVGAGVVVTENIPDFAIAIPNRKLLLLPRGESLL